MAGGRIKVRMLEVLRVAGSYEGGLYGWTNDAQLSESEPLTFGKADLVWSFKAHIGAIKAIAIDETGEVLATGGQDEYVRLFSVSTRRDRGLLSQHTGTVTALAFYKSTHLLSASEDGVVCIWRTHDWLCLHVLGGHKDAVNSIAIHPSGRMAFSASKDHTLRLWNLVEGRCAFITRPTVPKHCEIEHVTWSPEGGYYALSAVSAIQVFDSAQAGRPTPCFVHEQRKRINGIRFLSEDRLVFGGDDKCVHLVEVPTGQSLRVFNLEKILTGRIKAISVLPLSTKPHPGEQEEKDTVVGMATSAGTVHFFDTNLELDANDADRVLSTSEAPGKENSRLTCLSVCVQSTTIIHSESEAPPSEPSKKRPHDTSSQDTSSTEAGSQPSSQKEASKSSKSKKTKTKGKK